jgi:imidazolonepropionase-like amidohydrolase
MDDSRIIVAGSFIDGSGGDVRKNVFLAVRDGVITGIDSAARLPRHDGSLIDDFSHCTILPPLVDCSVSLSRSPSVDGRVRLCSEDAGLADKAALSARHIQYCHGYGVLGLADNDQITGLIAHYPRGMVTGRGMNIRNPVRLCPVGDEWRLDSAGGGDFLKIRYSANIEDEEGPSPRLDRPDLCRLLRQGGGKKTVVVANGARQVGEALAAGCEAIEQGYGMGEDNLRIMAEKGVLWIPSVLRAKNALDGAGSGGDVCCRFSQRYVAPGKPVPGAEQFWKRMLAGQVSQLSLARNWGVTTATGTGAGSIGILHGESMVEEMKLFIKAGYSLVETIRCASDNGAKFFGMEQLGMLTVGGKATFLIARGTMQQLPRKLSYLEGIYIDGIPSLAYRKNPLKLK